MEDIKMIDVSYTKSLHEHKLEKIKKGNLLNLNKMFTELIDLEEKINKCLSNDTKTKIELGGYLKEIKEKQLYEVVNCYTFEMYCKNVLFISDKYAYKLVKVFNFTKSRDVAKINYEDYTISQLIEMLNLDSEQLKRVKPEMTIQEMRCLKNAGLIQLMPRSNEDNENIKEEVKKTANHFKPIKKDLNDFNLSNTTYDIDFFTMFDKKDLSYIAWLIYDELNRLRKKQAKSV